MISSWLLLIENKDELSRTLNSINCVSWCLVVINELKNNYVILSFIMKKLFIVTGPGWLKFNRDWMMGKLVFFNYRFMLKPCSLELSFNVQYKKVVWGRLVAPTVRTTGSAFHNPITSQPVFFIYQNLHLKNISTGKQSHSN